MRYNFEMTKKLSDDTYWKIQNFHFHGSSNKKVNLGLFIWTLTSKNESELNSMTTQDWDLDDEQLEKMWNAPLKDVKTVADYESLNALNDYSVRMQVEYIANFSYVIEYVWLFQGKWLKNFFSSIDEFSDLASNFMNTKGSINGEMNRKGKVVDWSLNGISLNKFDAKFIKFLEQVERHGIPLAKIINNQYVVFPYWDLTFNQIIEFANQKFLNENKVAHGKAMEMFLSAQMYTSKVKFGFEFSKPVINKKIRIQGNDMEIDLAFVSSNILFVIECKNVMDWKMPVDKNESMFTDWFNQYIVKSVKQLNKIVNHASEMNFPAYEKIIPITITFGRNRIDREFVEKHSNVKCPENWIICDLESFWSVLQFREPQFIMNTISRMKNLKNVVTDAVDWGDWIGEIHKQIIYNNIDQFPFINAESGTLKNLESKFDWGIVVHSMKSLNNKDYITWNWDWTYVKQTLQNLNGLNIYKYQTLFTAAEVQFLKENDPLKLLSATFTNENILYDKKTNTLCYLGFDIDVNKLFFDKNRRFKF